MAAVLIGSLSALAQDKLQIELEIRNTPALNDDYLTWAPAPARIRLAVPGKDQTVVLTNDPPSSTPAGRQAPLDGEVLFAESVESGETASQDTLRLTLPGDGSWRSFVVAGKFGRPSTRDKDTVIEVHREAPDGPVVHHHELMVRIRKDARTLTGFERDRFLEALGGFHFRRNRYVYFVRMHDLAANGKMTLEWPDQSHRASAFLAWHRAFLLQFERELQEHYPDVALPYWVMPEPSNLFTPDFIGQNKIDDIQAVVDVEFSPGHPLENWNFDGAKLVRFPTDRTSAKELEQFSREQELFKPTAYDAFRRLLERNPHNNGHNWVGPWMQNCMISPRDPVFWPFHSGFDRLWAKWQMIHGRFGTDGANINDYSPADAYNPAAPGCDKREPNQCVPRGHHLRDTMWPWDGTRGQGVNAKANRPKEVFGGPFPVSAIPGLWPQQPAKPTPADLIDYTARAPGRLDMGFAYDDVPFTPDRVEVARLLRLVAAVPPKPVASTLARRATDAKRSDQARIDSLRELDEEAAISSALAILRDPANGGAELDAEAVEQLWVQMMFTNAGLARHDELHHALRQALTDTRRPVRVAAVRKLASMQDPAALDALAQALARPEGAAFMPEESIRLLQASGGTDRLPVVRPYLNHADPGVRSAAATALVRDPESHPHLLRMLGDRAEVYEVRAAALGTVLAGVPGALTRAAALLGEPSTDVRLRTRAAAAIELRLHSREPRIPRQELTALVEQLRRLELESLEAAGEPAFRALRAAEQLLSQPEGK